MATRSKDTELLDDTSIEKVIKLLEPEEGKAISKKDACAILNISYNTTRLGTIIDKYKEKKEKQAQRRAANRGKPATKDEVIFAIQAYLEGSPIDSICQSLARGAQFVHNILEEYAVPIRASSQDYFKPMLIPDGAVRETFNKGEMVYSARYDSVAKVEGEFRDQKGQVAYRIWLVRDKWKEFAYQPSEELASLEHLIKLGIKL